MKRQNEFEPQDEEEAYNELSISTMNGERNEQHDDLAGNIGEEGVMNNLMMMASSSESINSFIPDSDDTESQDLSGDYNEDINTEPMTFEEVAMGNLVRMAMASSCESMNCFTSDSDDTESLDLSGDYHEEVHKPLEAVKGNPFDINTESMTFEEVAMGNLVRMAMASSCESMNCFTFDSDDTESLDLSGDYHEEGHKPLEAVNGNPFDIDTESMTFEEVAMGTSVRMAMASSCESMNCFTFDSDDTESLDVSGDYHEEGHKPLEAVNGNPFVINTESMTFEEVAMGNLVRMAMASSCESMNCFTFDSDDTKSLDLSGDYHEEGHKSLEAVNGNPFDVIKNQTQSEEIFSGDFNKDPTGNIDEEDAVYDVIMISSSCESIIITSFTASSSSRLSGQW